MTEVTLTELRRNIFQLVDEMIATGTPLRVRRKGRTINLTVAAETKPVSEMTPEERFDRWMAKGPLPGFEDVPDDIDTNKSHWTWDPDTKFRDL